MEEEADLDAGSLPRTRGTRADEPGRPILGAGSGLLLAVILVLGVSLAAGGSLHIDLVRTATPGSTTNGLSTQSGATGGTAVAPSTVVQSTQASTASSGGSPASSIAVITRQSGGTVGLVLLPVLLGAVLGAIFYGAYARRVDLE